MMKKIKQSKHKILEGMLFYLVLREGFTKEVRSKLSEDLFG